MRERRLFKIFFFSFAALCFLAAFAFASLFLFHDLLGFTTSNSAIYIVKDFNNGIEIRKDLFVGEDHKLIFMLDASHLFNTYMREFARFAGRPILELTWSDKEGLGSIKKFGSDGTIFEVTFSRFREEGKPHGLFIGGDLPYGDVTRDVYGATSGMGYFDGEKWFHIWCAANEGFNLAGTYELISPVLWKHLGSSTIKDTYDEVILESVHELERQGKKVLMTRRASLKATDDYLTMDVTLKNPNNEPLAFSYVYADEPWVGKFGSSAGDVGWFDKGVIQRETYVDPDKYRVFGVWDRGNPEAGEGTGFTGYANFMEWISPRPDYMFLANDFACCVEGKQLASKDKRVIGMEWNNRLHPGESVTYKFAVGMAGKLNGFPTAPLVNAHS